jgi:hypothetical protein
MTLIGFWHGANWTFIAFGLYWGVVIALYLYSTERLAPVRAVPAALRATLAVAGMFVVVCVGWVFFRAQSIGDAWYVLGHLFSTTGAATVMRVDVPREALLWALIAGLLAVEWIVRTRPTFRAALVAGGGLAIASRSALAFAIVFSYLAMQEGVAQPFIYFQF